MTMQVGTSASAQDLAARSRRALEDAAAALESLERAQKLGSPSRQYYRLKAMAAGEATPDVEETPESKTPLDSEFQL